MIFNSDKYSGWSMRTEMWMLSVSWMAFGGAVVRFRAIVWEIVPVPELMAEAIDSSVRVSAAAWVLASQARKEGMPVTVSPGRCAFTVKQRKDAELFGPAVTERTWTYSCVPPAGLISTMASG